MSQKILIVDDTQLAHQMYTDLLEKEGYETIHAMDGIEAINQAFTQMPDLILLDIHMPKINGYQVCRLLKDHPATKHIPIIIQTSPDDNEMVVDPKEWSFQTGADGYIDKSEIDQIVKIITPILKDSQSTEQKHSTHPPMSEIEIMTALSQLLDKQLYLDITRLKQLDERKNAFVANVSHEIRSPLAIIQGYLDILKLDPLTEEQKHGVEASARTVQRLSRLVNDLLDIAKIEAGKMELKKEKIDLKKLADEVLQTYQVSADEKEIHLSIESPKKSPELIGDKDRLMQVIINLLYNAIKFIQDKGAITVRLSEDGSDIRIEVEDNGPGMSAVNLEKIFNKFERVTAEKKEGTGLGLPISKDIVSLHKGKIWVESKEGKGSKFIVTLPKKA